MSTHASSWVPGFLINELWAGSALGQPHERERNLTTGNLSEERYSGGCSSSRCKRRADISSGQAERSHGNGSSFSSGSEGRFSLGGVWEVASKRIVPEPATSIVCGSSGATKPPLADPSTCPVSLSTIPRVRITRYKLPVPDPAVSPMEERSLLSMVNPPRISIASPVWRVP